jgi:hypothetical protein
VGAVWALLIVNTIGSSAGNTVIPIPHRAAQLVTMGSLGVAFLLALLLNPRVRIRPDAFLFLVTLLAVESAFSSVFLPTSLGSLFRAGRLAVFVATLWLISRWWDDALRFVRHHIRTLSAILLTVLGGLIVAPGVAMPATHGGRLVDALWYLPAPRVAEYAAVAGGLALVLWLGRYLSSRNTLVIAAPAMFILILTHTRTATIALVVALVAAAIALFLSNARARRAVAFSTFGAAMVAIAFGTVLQAWLRRGQNAREVASLTGREKVWNALLAAPRTLHERLFGTGLSDKTFDGLPIDSTWLSVYQEQGLIGVAIIAAIFVLLLTTAAMRPPSPARALAIFLIVYCAVASYPEVGVGDATTYLLSATVAAALLTRGAETPMFAANATAYHKPVRISEPV